MADIKLAKDKVVKLKLPSKGVSGTFKKAVLMARTQKWNKMVIIGQGPEGGHYFTAQQSDASCIKMLEDVKYIIQRDTLG